MPLHIENMTAEVTVLDGDLPLTDSQVERIITLVVARLQDLERSRTEDREARRLTGSAAPPLGVEG
jgi:hypothetical protein